MGALNAQKIGPSTKPPFAPEPALWFQELWFEGHGENTAFLLFEDRNCEPLAALTTTVCEDLLAAALRHASAKSVFTDSADVVRLISAFHGGAEKTTEEASRQESMGEFGAKRTAAALLLISTKGRGAAEVRPSLDY